MGTSAMLQLCSRDCSYMGTSKIPRTYALRSSPFLKSSKSFRTNRYRLPHQIWRNNYSCTYNSIVASAAGNGGSQRYDESQRDDRNLQDKLSNASQSSLGIMQLNSIGRDQLQDNLTPYNVMKDEETNCDMHVISNVGRNLIITDHIQDLMKGILIGIFACSAVVSPKVRLNLVKATESCIKVVIFIFSHMLKPIASKQSSLAHISSVSVSASKPQPLRLDVLPPTLSKVDWSFSRFFYMLDLLLERNVASYLILLFLACCFLIIIGGFLFYKYRSSKKALEDCFWDSWACLCSSSTHLRERTTSERIVGLMLAIGGMLFYSLLISTMTTQFKSHMEQLKEGAHSEIMESQHVIICGVNSHLTSILKQLNKCQELAIRGGTTASRRQRVLLLSEQPKPAVEKMVAHVIKDCPHIDILMRSGSLSNPRSFQRAAVDKARSVIVLAAKNDGYEADADAVLSVLALQPLLGMSSGTVVVEVSDSQTGDLLKSLSGQKVEPVTNLASKLFVQCSRQRGLIKVYRQLLDHGSNVLTLLNLRDSF